MSFSKSGVFAILKVAGEARPGRSRHEQDNNRHQPGWPMLALYATGLAVRLTTARQPAGTSTNTTTKEQATRTGNHSVVAGSEGGARGAGGGDNSSCAS